MGDLLAIGRVDSPIGELRVAATQRGVVRIEFPHASGAGFAGWLKRVFSDAARVDTVPALEQVRGELASYFAGELEDFEVSVDLRGTEFQRSVWDALCAIPYGETRSYRDIAEAVDHPRAFRAVGLANGSNPVPIIVPCHRVIAAGGKLGGFGGGIDAKRKLLALEQSRVKPGRLV